MLSVKTGFPAESPLGPRERAGASEPILSAKGVSKAYGSTRALVGVDLAINPGQVLGLIGHNGAGKSTLMRLLAGLEAPDDGDVVFAGRAVTGGNAARGRALRPVRLSYQETMLCPELTVAENVALSSHWCTKRLGWRGSSATAVAARLDEIFPRHGISPRERVEDLSQAQRQMVEVCRATLVDGLQVLLLDEPSESLDADAARSLYDYVRAEAAKGVATLLISHRIGEILSVSDRVVVMRDGRIVGDRPAREVGEDMLLVLMGAKETVANERDKQRIRERAADEHIVAELKSASGGQLRDVTLHVRAGEVVGLAGLVGQGQKDVLERLWRPVGHDTKASHSRAYVPGDRRSAVLPLWSVADNLTVSVMARLARRGVVQFAKEREVVESWIRRLSIVGGPSAAMTALSGGNQQKVIVARAFASNAELVLLDDPFRGVDVMTRVELYALIRQEAQNGRSIVWYSTENVEMTHCDRVYVFRGGRVVTELIGEAISQDAILAHSFANVHGTQTHG
jgi:ribose transport system ATP-binding protein